MRDFRVGDKATWRGRDCTVVDRRPVDLMGQTIMRVRLRWESGTRNGKPRMRYTWVPESRCVLVNSPTAAQEAASVGRRGQSSQRQDVTEAAARVVARAPAPKRVPCPHSKGIGGCAGCALYVRGKKSADCPAGAECDDGVHCTIPALKPDPDALPTATTAPAPKPAPCAGCEGAAQTYAQGIRERDAKLKDYSDLLYRVTLITRAAGIESNDTVDEDVQQLLDHRDEATRLMADALCAKAGAEVCVESAKADRKHLLDELRRATVQVNEAHDALDAAGVAVDLSLAERVRMLANERDERVLEAAALRRAAVVTWWDKLVRVFAGVAIAVAMLHGLEWWMR